MSINKRLTAQRIGLGGAALLLMSITTGALAAGDAAAVSSGQAPVMQRPIKELQELDEVRVRGQATLNMLVDAENIFFRLYNQLEKDDSYRITCEDARLNPGSVVMTRVCVPGFFSRYVAPPPAISWSSCEGSYFDQTGYQPPGGCSDSGYEPPSMDLVLMERGEKWRRHMTQTVKSDPRLSAMADRLGGFQHQMVELQNRYVQIKREKRAALLAARGKVDRTNTGPHTL